MKPSTPAMALGAAVAGAVLCLVGAVVDPYRAGASYLVAYAAAVSAALGALSVLMIGRVTNATWLVAPRRAVERVAWTLPLLAALAVPLLAGAGVLYPWAWDRARMAPDVARVVAARGAWATLPVFDARAVVYLAAWVALAEAMRRASRREDQRADPAAARRLTRLSAGGLPVLAFTMTFAAFDWLMSLAPTWTSTIFGLAWWAGGVVAAVSLAAVLARRAAAGPLAGALGPAHFHAFGKLLFTFVLLWAYFEFSQLLVIWIANIPAEAAWYAVRLRGGWGVVSAVLFVAHLVGPFAVLLPRWTKRNPAALAGVGWWLLAAHYLDTYWLVMPEITPDGVRPHWLDLGALLFVGGAAVAFDAWRSRGVAAAPRGDPAFGASVAEGGAA